MINSKVKKDLCTSICHFISVSAWLISLLLVIQINYQAQNSLSVASGPVIDLQYPWGIYCCRILLQTRWYVKAKI